MIRHDRRRIRLADRSPADPLSFSLSEHWRDSQHPASSITTLPYDHPISLPPILAPGGSGKTTPTPSRSSDYVSPDESDLAGMRRPRETKHVA